MALRIPLGLDSLHHASHCGNSERAATRFSFLDDPKYTTLPTVYPGGMKISTECGAFRQKRASTTHAVQVACTNRLGRSLMRALGCGIEQILSSEQ